MEKKNNTIRLTEEEFNTLIEEAVMQVINEGKFGDFARKVGKGLNFLVKKLRSSIKDIAAKNA